MELEHLLLRQRQPITGDRLPLFFWDGAMGTELLRSVPPGTCLELLNIHQPALVRAVSAAYRRAGADVLTTNTFGANRARLALHGQGDQVARINRAAGELARQEAAGALVAGSIGPTGLQPAPENAEAVFLEQAVALHAAGVGLFTLETFGDLYELEAAVRAVRRISGRPIVAHVTVTPHLHTPAGQTLGEIVAHLAPLRVQAIGVNCAMGADTAERAIRALYFLTDLPLVVQPNAGEPRHIDGTWQYPLRPAGFAALARRLAPYVLAIGGCCGTTPEHIQEARTAAGKRLPAPPKCMIR